MAFYLSIFCLWAALFYWVYFRGGAEKLVRHPGILQQSKDSDEKSQVLKIKLSVVFMILGGIGGLIMMSKMNLPAQLLGH
jgi:hypothetical protein